MVTFCLIGGKQNKSPMTNRIENHLVGMTNKINPTILYFPFAMPNYEKSNNRFKEIIGDLKCNVIYMTPDMISDFDKLLNDSDILYIGGGISDNLIKMFRDLNLDIILKKYINTDKIYAGSSAGAMLYCKASMGDKDMFYDNFHYYNFKMVDGLGLLDLGICPHYQNEDLIFYNDVIKKYDFDAFGLEEDSAVIIKDNKFYCIKEEPKVSAYYFNKPQFVMEDLKEGAIYEKTISFRS